MLSSVERYCPGNQRAALPLLHPTWRSCPLHRCFSHTAVLGVSLAHHGPAQRDRRSWWESALGARPREGQFHFFRIVILIMQIGKMGQRGKIGGPLNWQGREEKNTFFLPKKETAILPEKGRGQGGEENTCSSHKAAHCTQDCPKFSGLTGNFIQMRQDSVQ